MAKFITVEEYKSYVDKTLEKAEKKIQKTMVSIIKEMGHDLVAVEFSGRACWGQIYELRRYLKEQKYKVEHQYNSNALYFNSISVEAQKEAGRICITASDKLEVYMKQLVNFNRVTTSLGTTIKILIK
ncbi:MAG: hypothetical protein ACI4E1_10275 [Lachnospira sp.]